MHENIKIDAIETKRYKAILIQNIYKLRPPQIIIIHIQGAIIGPGLGQIVQP